MGQSHKNRTWHCRPAHLNPWIFPRKFLIGYYFGQTLFILVSCGKFLYSFANCKIQISFVLQHKQSCLFAARQQHACISGTHESKYMVSNIFFLFISKNILFWVINFSFPRQKPSFKFEQNHGCTLTCRGTVQEIQLGTTAKGKRLKLQIPALRGI